jgi:hypothetical protein
MSAELSATNKQLLHLVLGGELTELGGNEFKDLDKVEIVGVFPTMRVPTWLGKRRRSRPSITPTCATS